MVGAFLNRSGFENEFDPTIEDSYQIVRSVDDVPIILDINDTGGHIEFESMHDQWIREADGYMLVYAIDMSGSFDEVKRYREKIVSVSHDPDLEEDLCMILVGNKCDVDSERKVPYYAGKELAKTPIVLFMRPQRKIT